MSKKKTEIQWQNIPGFEGEYQHDGAGHIRDFNLKQIHAPVDDPETGKRWIRLGGKKFDMADIEKAIESGKSLKPAKAEPVEK